MHRRDFLKATLASAALAPNLSLNAAEKKPSFRICAFEKPLQHLNFDDLGEFVAEVGCIGIEATVRANGHVLPERVEEDLPRLSEALKKRGLEITLMATDIKEPNAINEKVLRTAAKLGVKRYRTGRWMYDLKKPIAAQIETIRPHVKEVAAMNRQIGITGVYQNHAGANSVGASVWDLQMLLKDVDPKDLGAAFDIRHATVDGGSVSPQQFNLIRPHIGILYVKDFEWQGRKAVNVPLGNGNVDPAFFRQFASANLGVPISLHVEYPVPKERAELLEVFRRDLAALKSFLEGKDA